MTREPFLRLALVAACTGYLAAVAAAARWVTPWAWVLIPAAVVLAVVLSLVVDQAPEQRPLSSRQFRRLAGPKP